MKKETVLLLQDADLTSPVCVTGATGYVAGWIIRDLLEMGATVHATVRNPGNAASTAHLAKLADALPGNYIDHNVGYPIAFDNARSREVLGLKYRHLNQTLFEHFAQLVDDDLLPRR